MKMAINLKQYNLNLWTSVTALLLVITAITLLTSTLKYSQDFYDMFRTLYVFFIIKLNSDIMLKAALALIGGVALIWIGSFIDYKLKKLALWKRFLLKLAAYAIIIHISVWIISIIYDFIALP